MDAFASIDEYILGQRCPTCKAEPWVPCDAPRKAAASRLDHRQHASRQDAGARHYYRDVRVAPWPEDRVPGRSYSSLPGDGSRGHLQGGGVP